MRDERILMADPVSEEEQATELSLRPRRLDEFVGQPKLKERLGISIDAAAQLGKPLDHVLLSGPPGLGKTTLATILANELGTRLRVTSGPALERPGDLASMLTNLDHGDVFFVDEIHRLPRIVANVVLPSPGGPDSRT